jgi:hypothetical protein
MVWYGDYTSATSEWATCMQLQLQGSSFLMQVHLQLQLQGSSLD